MANVWPGLRTAQWTKVWNPSHLTKPDLCFSRVVSHFPIFVVQGAWWLERPPRPYTGPHFLPPRICMKENTHNCACRHILQCILLANSWFSPFRAIASYWLTSGTKLHCFLSTVYCPYTVWSTKKINLPYGFPPLTSSNMFQSWLNLKLAQRIPGLFRHTFGKPAAANMLNLLNLYFNLPRIAKETWIFGFCVWTFWMPNGPAFYNLFWLLLSP